MASSSGPALNEELKCSICLEVFTDPVTTPNFCRSCLSKCWTDTQTCFCPLCKDTFSKRPDLKINTVFGKLVQHLKKLNQEPEVFCDVCDERKQKAVKTCLICQCSYCETHLEPHLSVPRLKKHKLITAVENLEDYICQKHERPLELFCRDDQTCVCLSCTEGEHRSHNTVPIEEESRGKKEVQTQTDEQQEKIQEIEHSVLRKTLASSDCFLTSSRPVHISNGMIIGLGILLAAVLLYTMSAKRCQSEQLKMMEALQKAAEKQAEDLQQKITELKRRNTELQQEITELKRRNTELEQLSHTDDHFKLLQMYETLYSLSHTKNWTEISSYYGVDEFTLKRSLTQLKEQLNEKLTQTGLKFMQKFAVDVTLDPDTANPYLILSDDGKQVSRGDFKQDVPENPKRFDYTACVLAKQGFSSGRFYYEVQVKGKTDWTLGVARETINWKGTIWLSPDYGVWTVILRNENEYKACESEHVSLSVRVKPEKVGVFVDYEEGLVFFYDVESRSHLYSFTGQTFTEKLYPFFNPRYIDGGKNSNPLIITPVS